jgi:glycosyltransferase involved in cell wall biosynthesis
MLIGVDGNEANVKQRVGIGQFAYQVLRQFYQKDFGHTYQIYLKNSPQALTALPNKESWHYKVVGPRLLWTQLALPAHLFCEHLKPDVFFSPTHYAPRFAPLPTVVAVMDLSFLFFPEQFRKRDLWQLRLWTTYSVKKAKKVVAISEATKRDLIKHYHLAPDKVVVASPGYDKKKFCPGIREQKKEIRKVKEKYGIKGNYVISVGTLQPRKNYLRLIDAFSQIIKNGGSSFSDLFLVIVGKRGWLEKPIFRHISESGLENRVILTGFTPEKDLPYLYAGAQVFCLVSLYEGFGIPVLEATACGTPVILAKSSSLPEVGGNAAVLVDPENIQAITAALMEVLENKEKQTKLQLRGWQNVKRFSWKNCAQKIIQALEQATLDPRRNPDSP